MATDLLQLYPNVWYEEDAIRRRYIRPYRNNYISFATAHSPQFCGIVHAEACYVSYSINVWIAVAFLKTNKWNNETFGRLSNPESTKLISQRPSLGSAFWISINLTATETLIIKDGIARTRLSG